MSMYPCFLRGTLASLTTLLAVALTTATQNPLLGREAARLDGFTQPDGTNDFALELKPSVPAADGPREVVILVIRPPVRRAIIATSRWPRCGRRSNGCRLTTASS